MGKQLLDIDGLIRYTDNIKAEFMSGIMFEISITADQWNDNLCVVFDEKFLSSNKYAYLVVPVEDSRKVYLESDVRALDVEIDGYMPFKCSDIPTETLRVNVLRLKLGGV